MDIDNESQVNFYARVKQAQNQRKLNADYAVVDRKQENTLLLREVDTMNEDDILGLFGPNLKDDIVSIRLFPPIPGTRGFAFIEFKDAFTAIRAFTVKHRTTFTYHGHPKKVNLSRPTKGKAQEEEWKWDKVRAQREGRPEVDNTPRRTVLNQGSSMSSTSDKQKPVETVTTVPFSELLKATPLGGGGASGASSSQGDSDEPSAKRQALENGENRGREGSPDRSRARSPGGRAGSGARSSSRTSPPRRRSPARSSESFGFSRPPSTDPFRQSRDRRSPARSDRGAFGDRRREPYDDRRDRYDERRDRSDDRSRASSSRDWDSSPRFKDSRDDDSDRKRRR